MAQQKRGKFEKKGFQIRGDVTASVAHRPKRRRPHIAQEYREEQRHELADEAVGRLRPWARDRALGLG